MDHHVLPRCSMTFVLICVLSLALAGCGIVAFPVRTTSAVVKSVPVAGHAVAAPLDVTADTID